jgi:hypothetical protein
MKTLNLEQTKELFSAFEISNEEMVYVRGGEGEPIIKPGVPPVIL